MKRKLFGVVFPFDVPIICLLNRLRTKGEVRVEQRSRGLPRPSGVFCLAAPTYGGGVEFTPPVSQLLLHLPMK